MQPRTSSDRELRRATHALADGYLRAMFGQANYRALDRLEALPRIPPCVYLN